MYRRSGLLFIMAFLFGIFAIVGAQELPALTETYTSQDGLVSFSYPAEWVIETREDIEGEYLSAELGSSQRVLDGSGNSLGPELESGEIYASLGVFDLAQMAAEVDGIEADSPVQTVLQTIIDLGPPEEVTQFGDVTSLEIGGRAAARVAGTTPHGGNGIVLLVELGGGVLGGVILTTADDLDTWEPTALAIAESLTFSPDGATAVPALELTETYTTDDGSVSFDYPADWVVDAADVSDGILMSVSLGSSQEILDETTGRFDALVPAGEFVMQVGVSSRAIVANGTEVADDASAFEILEAVRPQLEDSRLTMGEVTEATIGGHPAALIEGEGEASAVLVGIIDLGSDLFGVFIMNSAPGELDQWRATALAIGDSIRLEGAATTTGASLDLTQAYASEAGNLRLSIPEGWLTRDGDETSVYIANTQSGLDASFGDAVASGDAQVYVWATTTEGVGEDIGVTFNAEDSPAKVLQAFTKAVPNLEFGNVETVELDGQRGALVHYTHAAFEGTAWVIEYEPGLLVLVQLIAAPGESGDWEATALAIGQSVEVAGS